MKKTFITLLALAGVAMGETITANAFSDNEIGTWSTGAGRADRGQFSIENGSLTLKNSNWSQAYANYELKEAITLTHSQSFTFSVSINTPSINGENVISLVTKTGTYLMGKTYNQDTVSNQDPTPVTTDERISYGSTTATTVTTNEDHDNKAETPNEDVTRDAVTYTFNTGIDTKNAVNVTPEGVLGDTIVFKNGATIALTGTVSWDGDSYSMLLSDGVNDSITWDLKTEEFVLTDVNFFSDGANKTTNVVYSNFAMSIVPEPATATLSLLALAGLAARRRRK
ncbi:MAG: PEP-CTERM sorting domain-containing protein [Akkermansiaceae bacterium]|nr:PEP-CTERM sorting domain-containing protein [Akkermansiaceae bacterium]